MTMYKKILVLVKASQGSKSAIETACKLAHQLVASVHLITILDKENNEVDELSSNQMNEAVNSCMVHDLPNATYDIIQIESYNEIIEKIVEIASDFDLIVMGHCKYEKIYKFLHNSVAEDLIKVSPCPVMIATTECKKTK